MKTRIVFQLKKESGYACENCVFQSENYGSCMAFCRKKFAKAGICGVLSELSEDYDYWMSNNREEHLFDNGKDVVVSITREVYDEESGHWLPVIEIQKFTDEDGVLHDFYERIKR